MITARMELITPETAKKYLEKNTRNYRHISRDRILCYAADMSSGSWQTNGEPIVFDEDETLKDGQHRLAAILYSKTPISLLVVRGVPRDTSIYDIGRNRTQTQIASANGMSLNTSIMGAVNIIVCRYKATAVPKAYAINYAEEHAELFSEAEAISRSGSKHGIGKKSAIIAAIYVFIRLGIFTKDDLNQFFSVFNSANPSGLYRDTSSVFVARKQILSITKNGRPQQKLQSEIITLAMSDFSNYRQRTRFYRTDNATFEKLLNKVCEIDGIEDSCIYD